MRSAKRDILYCKCIFTPVFSIMMVGRVLQAIGNIGSFGIANLMSGLPLIIGIVYASSLLTSLRTVAGSIGSAAFVAIMSAVAISSEASYGAGHLCMGCNINGESTRK